MMTAMEAVSVFDLEEQAQRVLKKPPRDYYASGAHDEITLRENRAAFDRLRLHYRVLQRRPDKRPLFWLVCERERQGGARIGAAHGEAGVRVTRDGGRECAKGEFIAHVGLSVRLVSNEQMATVALQGQRQLR